MRTDGFLHTFQLPAMIGCRIFNSEIDLGPLLTVVNALALESALAMSAIESFIMQWSVRCYVYYTVDFFLEEK